MMMVLPPDLLTKDSRPGPFKAGTFLKTVSGSLSVSKFASLPKLSSATPEARIQQIHPQSCTLWVLDFECH